MSEFVCAVAAPRIQKEYEEFASSRVGRLRIQERSDLATRLDDHAALAALPEGSLGREYLAFVRGACMGDAGVEDSRRLVPGSPAHRFGRRADGLGRRRSSGICVGSR
jgi:hypothetical protein